MKDKIYKIGFFALLSIPVSLLLTFVYFGIPTTLDKFAQTRIDIPLQDANCMAEFTAHMGDLFAEDK